MNNFDPARPRKDFTCSNCKQVRSPRQYAFYVTDRTFEKRYQFGVCCQSVPMFELLKNVRAPDGERPRPPIEPPAVTKITTTPVNLRPDDEDTRWNR